MVPQKEMREPSHDCRLSNYEEIMSERLELAQQDMTTYKKPWLPPAEILFDKPNPEHMATLK